MASHVFVVDGRVRKARIQTNQTTYLSDVLEQGCKKLGLKPEQFVLKYVPQETSIGIKVLTGYCRHNGKTIDLSRTMRLSGLPSGAQLDLVQASRSPTVISVALQLPENRRLTNKFPSTTSLWQILRVFETSEKLNFTERAVSPTTNSGTGRLFYETPILNVLNRELSSFVDLQKTLSQLGVTSGSVLLRLSFKNSQRPLEEAMQDISQYFKSDTVDIATATPIPPTPRKADVESTEATPAEPNVIDQISSSGQGESPVAESKAPPVTDSISPKPIIPEEAFHPPDSAPSEPSTSKAPLSLTVYAPPTNTTTSTTTPFNEADYIPTVEHAQSHQSRLQASTRNTRLLSDAELAKAAHAKAAAAAAVVSVRVRIRCPDLSMLETTFQRGEASAHALYALVRGHMRRPEAAFELRYVSQEHGAQLVTLKEDLSKDLIANLGWRGNVLVSMVWGENVPPGTRQAPVLREDTMRAAKSVSATVPEEPKEEENADKKGGFFDGLGKALEKGKEKLSSGEKEAKLKSLLGFGKKK
jgi:tether containing UBX domain for GLUT4